EFRLGSLLQRATVSRSKPERAPPPPSGGGSSAAAPKEATLPPLYEPGPRPEMRIRTLHEKGAGREELPGALLQTPTEGYALPPLSLLSDAKSVDQPALKKELLQSAELLEESLMSFGIEAKVGDINCGPTITSFEVHPAVGVKVQKITAL